MTFYKAIPLLVVILASCTLEPTGTPVIVQDVVAPVETQAESEPKEQEEIMDIKPIPNYQAFFVDENNQIYGIVGDTIDPIIIKTTNDEIVKPEHFGIVDGKITLAFKSYKIEDEESVEVWNYFKQVENKIIKIDSFPMLEEVKTITLDAPPFKIESAKSDDIDISKIYKDTTYVTYLPVVGAHIAESGLWFNVSETYDTRIAGLHYWPLDGNERLILPKGRLW